MSRSGSFTGASMSDRRPSRRAARGAGHEHFASHLIERRLLSTARGWESARGPLALLACAPVERHTLGLVCFGLVLADRGWRIAYLGGNPVDQVAEMSASLSPAAVVICSLDPTHVLDDADAIAELGRRHHTILAGGAASAALASARLGVHHADGDPLGTAQELATHPPAPPDAAAS